MAWKDNLREASFRGVPFFIETSQYTSGRRVVFHEFPNRDNPFSEDLGKVGDTFKVEGHILGDQYFEIKARLIAAANTYGPGELIHPYYGFKFVQCGAFSIDESTLEGGYAKISFQFYETTTLKVPAAIDDKFDKIADNKTSAISASKSKFDSVFSIAKAPAYVVDTARSGVNTVADLYTSSTKSATAVAEGGAELAFSVRNLKAEVNDLLTAPSKLSTRLIDSFALLEGALSLPQGRLSGFANFFAYGGLTSVIPFNTINRLREKNNSDAFNKFIHRVAVASAANEAPAIQYPSADDALKARDNIIDEIEVVLLNSDDDDVFNEFENLKALVAELLPNSDSDLPNVFSYYVENTTPSLVLAYDVFENLDSEDDLLTRNSIRNPAFIKGGQTLELLDVRKTS